jgi:glycosyltransferase involved in cell wall biosynthesis
MFFSLHRLTDPFPAAVHDLADFPTIAPAAGVTDIHVVFLYFAVAVLGIEGASGVPSVPPARSDISLADVLDRWGIRPHVTLYPGGGQFPNTDRRVFTELAQRCATVFTTVPEVFDAIPDAVRTEVPVPSAYYAWQERPPRDELHVLFVGDDRPRKGLAVLLDAIPLLGPGFRIEIVGPHDRYAERIRQLGARWHGWLPPEELRHVVGDADVIASPATYDRAEDGYGDVGLADGFPTTAARVAMLSGCCLVGSNPLGEDRLLRTGRDYVEVPERDPVALAGALRELRLDPARRRRIAACGAEALRRRSDVSVVVADKLKRMGLTTEAGPAERLGAVARNLRPRRLTA